MAYEPREQASNSALRRMTCPLLSAFGFCAIAALQHVIWQKFVRMRRLRYLSHFETQSLLIISTLACSICLHLSFDLLGKKNHVS